MASRRLGDGDDARLAPNRGRTPPVATTIRVSADRRNRKPRIRLPGRGRTLHPVPLAGENWSGPLRETTANLTDYHSLQIAAFSNPEMSLRPKFDSNAE